MHRRKVAKGGEAGRGNLVVSQGSIVLWSKAHLPAPLVAKLRRIQYTANLAFLPRCWINKLFRKSALLARSRGKVHVGCNTVRLPGYVNVDTRPTSATDIVHDCSKLGIFKNGSVRFLFSNAFLEHLYKDKREGLLHEAKRVLSEDGLIAFTGLPDFENVARLYLAKTTPGVVSSTFDVEEVYRYTHGAPEQAPSWWLAQLHKSLFDTERVVRLLRTAGFAQGIVFTYCWGNEPYAVTLGFIAGGTQANLPFDPDGITTLLKDLPHNIKRDTLQITAKF